MKSIFAFGDRTTHTRHPREGGDPAFFEVE